MKRQIVLMVLLAGGCKKSEPAHADEPAPTATENGNGSAPVSATPQRPVGDRRERMMKELDTNGDGVISDEERVAGRRKRVEVARTKLDTNADGKLSIDELKAATGRLKFDDPAAIDTNKDGDISIDELEAAMKARHDGKGSGD